MSRRLALVVLILSVMSLASGCAVNRATATLTPGADLSQVKTFYVVKDPEDGRGIENIIRDSIAKRGFTATTGPEMPQGSYKADAVVSYVDKWMWDITMYMLELTITLRNPNTGFPLAVGNSYHTSLTRKSPQEMVEEVLTNIFNTTNQASKGAGK
jgi:hypothetical protein